jgi:hypothetical protein
MMHGYEFSCDTKTQAQNEVKFLEIYNECNELKVMLPEHFPHFGADLQRK